ncbi:rhamnogalacturonan acetylesterase [Microbulbifer rhizosphaerae]|uniref:Lysophospholipase L1-like esterase n=1 Tax=Microbulbifer rhizosphaerae TaxID=1562603 RepID=A0A7W4WCR2_9GAMM|nr:rhamnogalacturonan acetylesterase [Microbulbifer rhizosphaerae]MBB3061176.1 lysophospholipase L1-like esterase [Microbulbifer rhizosphaerae]
MKSLIRFALALSALWALQASATQPSAPARDHINTTHIYLAGDSTMTDQTLNADYWESRHPVTGWGQKFEPFVNGENLEALRPLIQGDRVKVVNRARGGRSTRTFFEEGRWEGIYQDLKPGDLVLIQFGHNDASVKKTERYVTVEGYKQYLRLFIDQTRARGATPIILTPVARNYPWENGKLMNDHGEYDDAARKVAQQDGVEWIDLQERSKAFFSEKGQEYVSKTYFMNLTAGQFPAYPDGQNDNTHFQPEGGVEVARLVYEGLKDIASTH